MQLVKIDRILSQQSREIFDNINAKVVMLKLVPGMDLKYFDYLVQAGIEGLILE